MRREERLEALPGQYFVRVHPGAIRPHVDVRARAAFSPQRMAFTARTANSVPANVAEPLDYLRDNAGLKNVRPLFAEAGPGRVAGAKVASRQRDRLALAASVVTEEDDGLAGIALCEVDRKASPAVLERAESSEAIDFIEPVPARWLAARPDPMTNLQWGLRAIRFFDAKRPDATGVAVGVLDTGIDEGHPDIAGSAVEYHHPGTKAEDIVGHGTHVAGIVAAQSNNGVGIAGVASCALQVWKVFPDTPYDGQYYVDADLFAAALRGTAQSGLRVVNMSLGGTLESETERLLVRRLIESGVVVVAAMGNEHEEGNPTSYPAAYDDVLAVGSVAESRERSSFSNTGRHIGMCAPGSNVFSTLPRRRSTYRDERMYAAWSGTSMAAPHVAGAAALVAAKHPSWGQRDIVKHLQKTATTLPAMKRKSRTSEYGAGLLDLHRALK